MPHPILGFFPCSPPFSQVAYKSLVYITLSPGLGQQMEGSNHAILRPPFSPTLLVRPSPRVPTPCAFPAFRGRRPPLTLACPRILGTMLVLSYIFCYRTHVRTTNPCYITGCPSEAANFFKFAVSFSSLFKPFCLPSVTFGNLVQAHIILDNPSSPSVF